MELINSQTIKNLTRAFESECSDGAKYQYMADEAQQNKLSEVSSILKMLATNEMAHAKVFYDYIAKNTNTENLNIEIKASYPMQKESIPQMLKIKGENEEFQAQTVYPAFAKTAQKEGFNDIATKLSQIAEIENNHKQTLLMLYDKIKNNKLYSSNQNKVWKCQNCGFQKTGKSAWKKCPLCEKDQGFVKIEQ